MIDSYITLSETASYPFIWTSLRENLILFQLLQFVFQFFSLILFVLSGVDLLFAGNQNQDHVDDSKPERFSTAYFVAGSIKAATFVSTSR